MQIIIYFPFARHFLFLHLASYWNFDIIKTHIAVMAEW